MRNFSTNIKALLLSEHKSFYLIKVVSSSVSLYVTTAAYDISFEGHNYLSNSGLVAIDSPRLSQTVDRETYKLTYTDPLFEVAAMFDVGITGAAVESLLCFYNTTGAAIGGYAVGMPILDRADMIVAYGGVVDSQGYTVSPQEGTVTAILECSSPVASLGLVRSFFTSGQAMKARDATDVSFDQINVGSKKVGILWGKASL